MTHVLRTSLTYKVSYFPFVITAFGRIPLECCNALSAYLQYYFLTGNPMLVFRIYNTQFKEDRLLDS